MRDGAYLRSSGWLESNGRPLAGAEVPPDFSLESPGTRIAVLGYERDEDAWEKSVATEVIAHFFHAVCHDSLRVDVGSATISSETLDGWLESQDAAVRERVDVSRSPVADSAFIEGIGKVNLRVKIHEDDANRSKTLIFVRDRPRRALQRQHRPALPPNSAELRDLERYVPYLLDMAASALER